MRTLLVAIAILLFPLVGSAQTYPIADNAFVSYLKGLNPNLINAQDELVIAEAETYAGAITLDSTAVRSLDGVQHFKSLTRLYVAKSSLDFIPAIDSLKALKVLHLTELNLSTLPDLSNLQLLEELSLYENQLTTLSGLENLPNLKELIVFKNDLQTLPTLVNPTGLELLHLGGNMNLDQPDLSSFVNLRSLVLWGTNMTTAPDLSSLTNLEELNLGSNQLTDAPDLTPLVKLKRVYLDHNEIRDLPDGIKELPLLEVADLRYNEFSLNDLLELTVVTDYDKVYTIHPQQYFPLQSSYAKISGESIMLTTDNDITVSGVYYVLKKGEDKIDSNATGQFVYHNLQKSFEGSYQITIQTPALPNVFLESNDIQVNVQDCVSPDDLSIEVSEPNCLNRGVIMIDHIPDSVSTFKLIQGLDTVSTIDGSFTGLQPGEYELITSTLSCNSNFPTKLFVEQIECKEYLLSPNSGLNTIELEYQGEIKVFDKQGHLTTTLEGPLDWDGMISGKLLDVGYYFLDINSGEDYVLLSVVY